MLYKNPHILHSWIEKVGYRYEIRKKKKENPKHHSTQSETNPVGREVGGIHKRQNEVVHPPVSVHLRGISLLFPTRAASTGDNENNNNTAIEEEEEERLQLCTQPAGDAFCGGL